ncbi:hypothetical protein MAR_016399 [Mya arenaria]|uniref:Uncharacterized protein n=1 Tax=Mya arenaria TaxID=6604 RepID=A0ABY7FK30_MYAAR|nr:hypothetical protein MAR_016399 [Mya arenaria]
MDKRSEIEVSENSFGSKMDRIKPEKLPRQRVQKLWRNVRWAETFPDDSLTVDEKDITPNYALRKVALLFENKKFRECASLIRRLNCVTLSSILHEVPIEVLHDSLPQSLNVLEALYGKLYETSDSPEEFPKDDLQIEHFLLKLVGLFAQQSSLNNKHEKNSNSVYPSCRSILRIISWVDPNTRRNIRSKKRELDKCLRHLGRHGLVESSEGSLMNLHDAFKIEFEKVVYQYRCALHKLEELNLSSKHPTGSSVIWGPAPSSSSHHRLMQITRDDVQERIIKNRTLYNLSEPAILNQYLKKFIHALEKRIEYDKVILFHDTELKKISRSDDEEQKFLSVSLKEFSMGYSVVLQLLKEVAEEDAQTDDGDDVFASSDEDTISPLMHKDRVRSLSSTSSLLSNKSSSGTRPSIIHMGQTFRQGGNGLQNGFHSFNLQNGTLPARIGKMISVGEEKSLEHQVDVLRAQLDHSLDTIHHLQEREKQCLQTMSELQLQINNQNSKPQDVAKLQELLSFRSVQQMLHELRGKVRHLLKLPVPNMPMSTPDDPVAMEMETHIENYLCRAEQRFDISTCVQHGP